MTKNSISMKKWFAKRRLSREICMLIPMEAAMGLPVEIVSGSEYLIPFYICRSGHPLDKGARGSYPNSDDLSVFEYYPPFAYVRLSYPDGRLLDYCDLRAATGWRRIDCAAEIVDAVVPSEESSDEYYRVLTGAGRDGLDDRMPDVSETLRDCIKSQRPGLLPYYEKLLTERERFLDNPETGGK